MNGTLEQLLSQLRYYPEMKEVDRMVMVKDKSIDFMMPIVPNKVSLNEA